MRRGAARRHLGPNLRSGAAAKRLGRRSQPDACAARSPGTSCILILTLTYCTQNWGSKPVTVGHELLLSMWVWRSADRYISGVARSYQHTWGAGTSRLVGALLGIDVGARELVKLEIAIDERMNASYDGLPARCTVGQAVETGELKRLKEQIAGAVAVAQTCSFRGGYVNIGANLGSLALPVAAWLQRKAVERGCADKEETTMPAPVVVAYEASRANSALLQRSIDANGLLGQAIHVDNVAIVSSPNQGPEICLRRPCHDNMGTLSLTDSVSRLHLDSSHSRICPNGAGPRSNSWQMSAAYV